jgi:hypothetical protein
VATSVLIAAIVLAVAQVARYLTNAVVAIARFRSEERRQRMRIAILMYAYERGGSADLLAAGEALGDQDTRAAVDLSQSEQSPDGATAQLQPPATDTERGTARWTPGVTAAS